MMANTITAAAGAVRQAKSFAEPREFPIPESGADH
jgi:hypothetical protein